MGTPETIKESLKSAEVVVAPVVIQTPDATVETVPKNKEEWMQLAKDNPQRWIELSQPTIDRSVREAREARENLERERQQRVNLEQELNQYRHPKVEVPEGQKYDLRNPPKTKDEWDTLFFESPTYASDLRNAILNRTQSNDVEFNRAFSTSLQDVQGAHPELYVLEVNEDGQPKRDGKTLDAGV